MKQVYCRVGGSIETKSLQVAFLCRKHPTTNYALNIPIVKPIRCTISQIYFILEQHYMFRTVFPSIIGSLRLYIQHQVYVIQVLQLLASKQPQNRPKHVECCSKIKKNLRQCASGWFLLQKYITMHGPTNVRYALNIVR